MIIVDIETSGLDAVEHAILSIGAVDFDNPELKFYGECKLREGAQVDPKALEVNGFLQDKILNCEKSCEDLLNEFLEWTMSIEDKTLAGHNVHFDVAFLKQNFKIYGIKWFFGHRYVDSFGLFYAYLKANDLSMPMSNGKSAISLDSMIDYFKLSKRGVHNALEDAELTREVFVSLFKLIKN